MRAHVNSYVKQKSALALEFVPLHDAAHRNASALRFVDRQHSAIEQILQGERQSVCDDDVADDDASNCRRASV